MFLCGDVMLGRGVDQILPHPGNPALCEPYISDAEDYVALAEAASGPIPRPVGFDWPWGDALPVMAEADVRVVNLETTVTRSDDFAPGKGIHYRMNPDNLPCLVEARPDVCVLANNHVLDFGRRGLVETLDALAAAGLTVAGAGHDAEEACRPAVVSPGPGRPRVLVFAFGMPSSGVPYVWAAGKGRPGVNVVPEPSEEWADEIADWARQTRRPGDITVASVHWGSNWGYGVAQEQIHFARRLVDSGIDVVHGHSSHHPRPAELYRGRLILYGCGDFIDDYEGISGYEEFRPELRLAYLVTLEHTGRAARVRMVPLRTRQMRLRHASPEDTVWLCETLNEIYRGFGSRVRQRPDGTLVLLRR